MAGSEAALRPMRRLQRMHRLEQGHDGSPLPGWRLSVFALPDVAMRAATLPLSLYVPAMLSEEFGLGLAAVGAVFAAIRFVDMAWDPAIAIFLDKTHTRFGRRRPWMVAATPILMLAIVLLYMPGRVVGSHVTPAYLFGALVVLYIGTTFFGLSHGAWAAELSSEYHERSRVQAYREWVATAGGMAILAIPIFFEFFVEADRMRPRVEALAWFALVMIPMTMALNVFLVPERASAAPKDRIRFLTAIKVLFSNPHLVRIATIDTLIWLQMGVSSTLMVFFVKYWIQVPEGTTTVIFIAQTGTLVAIPLWTRISRRIGKHRAMGIAYAVHMAATAAAFVIQPGDIVLFWGLAVFSGAGAISASFLLKAITVDIVDYDNWKSGEERTALFFAVLSTTARIGPSIAIGVTLPALALFGFDPAAGDPDADAVLAMRYVFLGVPILAIAVASYLLYTFRLDETTQKELRQMIEQRDRMVAPGPSGSAGND